MPLPDSAERTLYHNRVVNCQGFHRQDGLWDIEAHLIDTKTHWFPNHEKNGVDPGEAIHQMSLRLTLDLDFNIRGIAIAMDETPFGICRQVEKNMSKLEGMAIGPGWLKLAREKIGRTESCTHIMELLTPIATTAYQTMHMALEEKANQLPERNKPPIIDQCHSLASHREVVKVQWPAFYSGK